MSKKLKGVIENIVLLMIALVLIQTFIEDLAVLSGWNWRFRIALMVSGFVFDLFFTIEFFSRFFTALFKGEVEDYIIRRRGWIDFFASVPLLLLSSGPAFFALLIGGFAAGGSGLLNLLKVVKAVRVARVLRLLRVLKIFKQIKYADSPMAQRHMNYIISLSIVAILLPLIFVSSILDSSRPDTLQQQWHNQQEAVMAFMDGRGLELNSDMMEDYAYSQTSLLMVKHGDKVLFSRFADDKYEKYYSVGDYSYTKNNDWEFFFDQRAPQREEARLNLIFFFCVITLVFSILFVYSPHFAMTITDPLFVMEKGMLDSSYNLEVRVPEAFEGDDVFQLSLAYNDNYLPMKLRVQAEGSDESSLDIDLDEDNLEDLFKL